MKKLMNKSGETLVEVLLTIVITLLAMLFLSTSLLTAQKINANVKQKDVSFHYDETTATDGTVKVKVGTEENAVSVEYYTDNGYTFYEAK